MSNNLQVLNAVEGEIREAIMDNSRSFVALEKVIDKVMMQYSAVVDENIELQLAIGALEAKLEETQGELENLGK